MALNLLPKGTGRRRAIDKVAELRRDLSLALSQMHAAGDEIALLQQDLAVARGMQAEAEEIVVQQQAEIDDLAAERDQWMAETLALKARFAAQLAAEANTHRIDVPPMVRDTTAIEDQATGPIDVRPLWDARGIRPVTDPGRI
ncbi:hypothetical protein [Streptomyces sp. NPDC050416]|uniref:hypothetical protein n=1 Tax=Streptomyces sp. NPDC050416 TaxID=3365611 RepID=UPI00378AF073